ncbi:MAG TPA: methyltransferase domain-containing protein [Candidatus Solibacter sp.]|nr:methyltransferase domain-containing protein [Candidatus Solibacter sp.]
MTFVCPACKGALTGFYECRSCARSFPVIHGIPDFRLFPDPYIGIEEDRIKAANLFDAPQTRGFREMLDYYYSITKEVSCDLAARWTEHAVAGAAISAPLLREAGFDGGRSLLDVGCATGGLLIAAKSGFEALVGVDVALRWLIIGAVRLREAGVRADLVCANAEALPFPGESFDHITSVDTVEHLRDAGAAIREAHRVATPGARSLWATNNRYAPFPDPQVHLWGVGWLPRAWQADYVAWRRNDLHRYRVQMRSVWELDRLVREAGFHTQGAHAAPLFAPHRPNLSSLLAIYNRIRRAPLLKGVAPRIWIIGTKVRHQRQSQLLFG